MIKFFAESKPNPRGDQPQQEECEPKAPLTKVGPPAGEEHAYKNDMIKVRLEEGGEAGL